MKAAVGRSMAATHKNYKNDYDAKGCREPQICVGDDVYVDHPRHAAYSSNSINAFPQKEYNKLINICADRIR